MKQLQRHLVAGILLFICSASVSAENLEASQDIPAIEQSLLLKFLADTSTLTLIDARSEEEYETGHLYGAINVPHDGVDAAAAALPEDSDAPLVVYCRTGKRATALSEQLRERGYTNVRVLGPAQMFWSDTAPMFNCGVPAAPAPGFLPERAQQ